MLFTAAAHTNIMVCIPLPLTTRPPLKVLLELLSLGYCSGIESWHDTDTQPCAGQGWYRASAPECRVYPYLPWESACELGVPGKWKAFLFLLKSLSSLSLTIFLCIQVLNSGKSLIGCWNVQFIVKQGSPAQTHRPIYSNMPSHVFKLHSCSSKWKCHTSFSSKLVKLVKLDWHSSIILHSLLL